MITTILLLHFWSVVLALFWLRALRLVPRGVWKDGKETMSSVSGIGHFLAGSFGALFVFILAFGRPLPWLLPDVYRASSGGELLATAIFEEITKWGLFLLGVYGAGATHSRRQGMEQGALVAIGFAITQNAFYFLRYPELPMLLRPMLVTGVNVIVAATWGYATAAFFLERSGVTQSDSPDPAESRKKGVIMLPGTLGRPGRES